MLVEISKATMKKAAIFLLAIGLAVGVTIPKLHRELQIMGWIHGASVTHEIVKQKLERRSCIKE